MSKKLIFALVGVFSTAEEMGTVAAHEAKASEKHTPRVLRNMLNRFVEDWMGNL
jgi:L-asparagine transporter-like permease